VKGPAGARPNLPWFSLRACGAEATELIRSGDARVCAANRDWQLWTSQYATGSFGGIPSQPVVESPAVEREDAA
jgi:hypothetical protein